MAKNSKKKSALKAADAGLGDLEASVMQVIWKQKRTTVKDVFIELYPKRRLAYTTIMTVMRRLAEKGILDQDRSSKTYYYTPKIDQEKMAINMVEEVVDKVMGGSSVELLIRLINSAELSKEELAELESELSKVAG